MDQGQSSRAQKDKRTKRSEKNVSTNDGRPESSKSGEESASEEDSSAAEEVNEDQGNTSYVLQPESIGSIVPQLKDIIAGMKKHQSRLEKETRRAEQFVYSLENLPGGSQLSPNELINRKLSDHAAYAISSSRGPLSPEKLTEFLMEKAFSRPRPSVLPIVRQFTPEIERLLKQLEDIKDCINDAHSDYKEKQRRLSENLNKRITKLLKNIKKEFDAENRSNKRQTSITRYVSKRPRRNQEDNTDGGKS